MMKQVYGVPGDLVCIRRHVVWINGKKIAPIVPDYAPGKSLPKLHYCQRLPKDQYFMMSTHLIAVILAPSLRLPYTSQRVF